MKIYSKVKPELIEFNIDTVYQRKNIKFSDGFYEYDEVSMTYQDFFLEQNDKFLKQQLMLLNLFLGGDSVE